MSCVRRSAALTGLSGGLTFYSAGPARAGVVWDKVDPARDVANVDLLVAHRELPSTHRSVAAAPSRPRSRRH